MLGKFGLNKIRVGKAKKGLRLRSDMFRLGWFRLEATLG